LGGSNISIDGKKMDISERFVYKGQMMDRVPNLSMTFGYTNASWSLGSDLCSRYICKLLNHMKENGYAVCQPNCSETDLKPAPLTNLSSGYLQRAKKEMPKAATKKPWVMKSNYFVDYLNFKFEGIRKDMEFFPARS
jgi:monooxygenase